MSFKPGDFFSSIVDLLGILAPGLLLLLLITTNSKNLPFTISTPPTWLSMDSVVFLLAAFVLGHFIHFLGALALNPLYALLYLPRKLRKHHTFWQAAERIATYASPTPCPPLRFANAFLRLQHPVAAIGVDRLEATSKFFRGIALLGGLLFVTAVFRAHWELALSSFVITLLSFWRFANQRWKRDLLTYEFFVIACPQAQSQSKEQDS